MSTTHASTQAVHTNRLIDSTSPYLLQHAHNPVDWYPWGPEALAKARREDRPIFLSIGYSACHWCHVMERESFENEEIARILNQHFIAIKVDREERPDLDEIYMSATMIANRGQGGWPMSVFLTPEQRPFFAGTYFPPESRHGMPGFKDILLRIARMWHEDRDKVNKYADSLVKAVEEFSKLPSKEGGIPRTVISEVTAELAKTFDSRTGGLLSGRTNKFPPSMAMSLMLREYAQTREQPKPNTLLLDKVKLTLDHMAGGGIYDHLGGGIHRYSTDPMWLVPHFEKMLYDQALVSGVYIEAFQVTGERKYAELAKHIFDYVIADLRSSEGVFHSSRDADSEGVEGKFYVWSKSEVMSILGEEVGELFCSYYDVSESGNWDGHNILNVQRDLDTVARLNNLEPAKLKQQLAKARAKLLAVRAKRVQPGLDDKILTSWNSLMIASLAHGGRVLGESRYVHIAAKAADFVLSEMSENRRLLRTYRNGRAHIGAYLDDYAFFVEALLDLYEATFNRRWLAEAIRLNDDMIEHFWDEAHGAFFFTADDAEQLLVRTKDTQGGAVPSGNSVALMNLLRLALIQNRQDLRAKAEHTIRAFAANVERSPFGLFRFLAAVDFHYSSPKEIVIVGLPEDLGTQALIRAVDKGYDPHKVVLLLDPSAKDNPRWQKKIPLLQGKTLIDGKPAAYVCRNYTCRRPVTSVDELLEQLRSN